MTEYSSWLAKAWGLDALAGISEHRGRSRGQHVYTRAQLGLLREAYVSLDRAPTIAGAFDALLSTVLEPYLPEKRTGVALFFRDWPIPCLDDDCFAPEERGAALVPPDIMTGRIVVYLPKDEDLSPLDALLQDWE